MIKPRIFRWVTQFYYNEAATEINRELPFAALLFTLLAASGVTIYESWKKLCNVELMPTFQKEAREIVRQVEVLGYDPLTVMHRRAEKTRSRSYREFLLGYVSSVRSGGNVVNYLKSKLRSTFEVQSATAIRSIERLGTLVEAYAVMLIVTLCSYILFIVFSATSVFEPMQVSGTPSLSIEVVCVLIFLANPIISLVFMIVANAERKSNFLSLNGPYKAAIIPTIVASLAMIAFVLLSSSEMIQSPGTFTLAFTVCLLGVSVPPAIAYMRLSKANLDAENAMPSFLRDVTEARKIGLSPEKSIVHAAKRTGYGRFTDTLGLVRSQMEWGVSLKKIFVNLKEKIQTWPVLATFLIMVETIRIGGGSATALEILTEYSEKQKDTDANKRSLLKPYVILAFIWSVLIALTTTMVAMTVYALTQISLPGTANLPLMVIQQQMNLFSVGIILQCWLSGFFVGKVNEGTFAAGFKYSAMLVLTAYVSLVVSQNFLGGLYGIAPVPA